MRTTAVIHPGGPILGPSVATGESSNLPAPPCLPSPPQPNQMLPPFPFRRLRPSALCFLRFPPSTFQQFPHFLSFPLLSRLLGKRHHPMADFSLWVWASPCSCPLTCGPSSPPFLYIRCTFGVALAKGNFLFCSVLFLNGTSCRLLKKQTISQ